MSELRFEVMQTPAKINVDFESAKQQVQSVMDDYRGLVFTEDTKKDAKSDLADLRKYRKAIVDKRSDVKKAYMEPYNRFDSQVKELLAIVDEPITFIDGQVKAFEEKRVREKRAEIESVYQKLVPDDLQDYIPLECIYGSKWDNATTSMKLIQKEISDIAAKTLG